MRNDDSEPTSANEIADTPHPAAEPTRREPSDSRAPTRTLDQPRDTASSAAPRPLHTGTTLGHFTVLGILGEGGMGVVYRAYDRTLDRPVAVKVLRHGLDLEYDQRLLREAKALAQLSHPNVVQVYEVGQVDGQSFVAMELLRGQTLRRWQQQRPQPSWRACVRVYRQAGAGLAAAHQRGLVHRDFKPSNAIVDHEGRVRVLDFGLARAGDDGPTYELHQDGGSTWGTGHGALDDSSLGSGLDRRLTRTGLVMGTPMYMPLEQMRGEAFDARGDQFSFCVALYEAVYGVRPFAGDSLAKLRANLADGRFAPRPRGPAIPTKLHEIICRGLAVDPEHRWPSMDALLHALQALDSPRRRVASVLGLGLGLVAAGTGLVYQAEVGQRCTGGQAQLDGLWDDDARSGIVEAIRASVLPYAEDTAERVHQRLDEYADAWVRSYRRACEATTIRHEQSEAEMSLRMGCLQDHRAELRAVLDVLRDADDDVVTKAVALVDGLPRPSRCDDVQPLARQQQRVPPPWDPEIARQVSDLRDQLRAIDAQQHAGRYASALEAVDSVVALAEDLSYPPLLAEATLRRGSIQQDHARYDEAEQDLQHAYALAVEHDHEPVELQALTTLAYVAGVRQERHAEGLQWLHAALPLATRLGEQEHIARAMLARATVLLRQGQYAPAEAEYRRAVERLEQALGPEHPDLASARTSLGAVLFRQGEHQAARAQHHRALSILERTLGPEHPRVAYGVNNLAIVLQHLRRYEEAEALHRRALRIFTSSLGPTHPTVGASLDNLGLVLTGQGRLRDAEALHRRALRLRRQALGADHPEVANSLDNLAQVLMGQQRWAEAGEQFRRALLIKQAVLGADHPDLVYSISGLVHARLQGPDPLVARELAERAVSIREAAAVAPELLAEARFALARVLWLDPAERTRARTLAEQAREAYATAGPAEARYRSDVEDWLAAHTP
ncbi:MAG: tetratricopeptide repeat protein [Myxococcota bacterium]